MTDVRARVAFVTCAELPQADADTRLLVEPLAHRDVEAVAAVWDDPSVHWDSFDLAIVRSCWDYAFRHEEFLNWAARVPRLANAAEVISWNTDKRYLSELRARGIPVIPTTWVRPGDDCRLPAASECDSLFVIKPAVSLSALDTGRYDLADRGERRLAEGHVRRLLTAGRTVMIQPYMSGIDRDGETSLVFIAGRFSHAVRKGAVLEGPDRGLDNRFAADGGLSLQQRQPTGLEVELAQRVLAASGFGNQLLFARVDVVPGANGSPVLMELELTEPQLYFGRAPEALDRFVAAIANRVNAPACV